MNSNQTSNIIEVKERMKNRIWDLLLRIVKALRDSWKDTKQLLNA